MPFIESQLYKCDSLLMEHVTLCLNGRGGMKLTESEGKNLKGRVLGSRASTQSYILTTSGLIERNKATYCLLQVQQRETSNLYTDYSRPNIIIIIIIIIYPLTARVVGAPQMISQPISSIFPCSPLPSMTWRTPGLSIP